MPTPSIGLPKSPAARTALVVGASGAFGHALARELLEHGWTVRSLGRSPTPPPGLMLTHDIQHVQGSALATDDVLLAARDTSLIVHAFNVPYAQWHSQMLTATEHVANAAEQTGSTIILPGNVYGLGADFSSPLDEHCSHDAVSVKGQLRNQLEARLHRATRRGARLLIVRAGDFFGPGPVRDSWLRQITRKAVRGGPLLDPSSTNTKHEWAYLPDLARVTAALVARRDELSESEVFHFSGYQLTSDELMNALQAVLGPRRVKAMPWALMKWVAAFSPAAREALDIRYLWDKPVLLSDAKLRRFLGDVRVTPLSDALRSTLGPTPSALPPSS